MSFLLNFNSEEACERHLIEIRFPDGMRCLRCGSQNIGERLPTRRAYQCRDCRFFNRPTAGTLFHRTRTTLLQWFIAIFLMATDKRGLSALYLGEQIEVSYPTAWAMLQRMRRAMAKRDAAYKLRGYVEIDEMFIGSPSEATKRGRGTEKTPVLVAVSYTPIKGKEEVTGFAKLQAVDSVTEATVLKFVKAQVEPGSTIRTDGLSVYPVLERHGFKHDQEPVKKRKAHLVLPHVHTFISNLRAFVQGTHHGLSETHLQHYLDEFCYRFNRRHRHGELFDRLLLACIEKEETSFAALTE
jgi:transposase-like protein